MKKCPYCAEDIQDDATKCKHCGSSIKKNDAKQDVSTDDGNKPRYKRVWVWLIMSFIWPFFGIWYVWQKTNWEKEIKWAVTVAFSICLVAFVAVGDYDEPNTPSASNNVSQNNEATQEPEDLSVEARTMSQIMVEQALKAPSTADFPWSAQEINAGISGDPNFYKVRSYVDSENGFGANVRTDWLTMLKYDGVGSPSDGDSWEFIYFELDGQELIDTRGQ